MTSTIKQSGNELFGRDEPSLTQIMDLVAVQRDGRALEFIKEQTPESCLAAVEQDGYALKYVKEQTPELCLAAVRKNSSALQYVRNQTPELCSMAIQQTLAALNCINKESLTQFKEEEILLVKELRAQNNARDVKAYQYKGTWYFFVGCQWAISKERFITLIHEDGGLEKHPHRQHYLDFLVECVA